MDKMDNIELNELRKYVVLKGSLTDAEIREIKERIGNGMKKLKKMTSNNVLNLKKDVKDSRDFKLNESSFSSSLKTTLPEFINWQPTMSPVKDQKSLGSCVGFATAAMKEWQEQQEHQKEVEAGKKYLRDKKEYDLSEAWIYWNCKKIDPWPNEEGTSIRCAMQVLHKIGVPCEKAYPYSDTVKGNPESWAKMVSRWGLIDSYWRCYNLEDLRTALVNGPVVIGIACFREIFFVGSNGIIPYPNNPDEIFGGHAVCAVGYSDKNRYIRFKNSWGPNWGRNGYGFIPYQYVEDFMWDAWIAKDLSVNKKQFVESMDSKL